MKNTSPIALVGHLSGIGPLLKDEFDDAGFQTLCAGDIPSLIANQGPQLGGAVVGVDIDDIPKRRELTKRTKALGTDLHLLLPFLTDSAPILVIAYANDRIIASRLDELLATTLRKVHTEAELERACQITVNALDVTGSMDYRLAASRIVDFFERQDIPVSGELISAQQIQNQSLCSALASNFAI
ncbi:hypothetical protein GCM10027416_31170 [Okibacterium endophyticum]